MTLNEKQLVNDLEASLDVSKKMSRRWKQKCSKYRTKQAELILHATDALDGVLDEVASLEQTLFERAQIAIDENKNVTAILLDGEDDVLELLQALKRTQDRCQEAFAEFLYELRATTGLPEPPVGIRPLLRLVTGGKSEADI